MLSPAQISQLRPQGRVNRNPRHTWTLITKPWQIQPCMIAPVLPGETMKNLLIQARVVTDPIKNPLLGWWQEYYFFYVKHRDLDERQALQDVMIDPTATLSSMLSTSASLKDYFGGSTGGAINWTPLLLKRITEEYFRDEGEAWNVVTIDGRPAANINRNGWWDSITDAMPAGDDIPDDADNATIGDLSMMMSQYEFLRAQNLINMSYEDYLKSFGVRQNRVEIHKPELIRYVRDWAYPSNTVNPETGVPASAVSWAIQERADKDRFFTEPGFVFGVSVTRPKVNLGKQRSAAVSLLDTALSWLPAIMRDEVYTSLKAVDKDDGPLSGTTNDYWVDVRDLFIYGDQFVNFALTATDQGLVALPTAALQRKYASETDADALFVSDTKETIRQDGVCTLTIAGTQRDHT